MADTSVPTSKKSGFSFRKRSSSSKTRKSEDSKPDDIEAGEGFNDLVKAESGENSAVERNDITATNEVHPEAPELKTSDDEGATVDTPSSAEDSSPKSDKTDESPDELTKKSKRRSRSLFRKNSKNKDAKSAEEVQEANEDAARERETEEKSPEVVEAKASNVSMSDSKQQVVYDEPARESEITEQNDAECVGNPSGEVRETEGKVGEKSGKQGEKQDEQREDSSNEAAEDATSNEKKGKQKKGTKRKSFFKRSLSLKRSKSKKTQQEDTEAKENKPATKKSETCEIGMSTVTNSEAPEGTNEDKANTTEASVAEKTEGTENQNASVITKNALSKPVRKVSFVEPKHPKGELSEGDSPSEKTTETGKDFQVATPPPSKASYAHSESVAKVRDIDDCENPKIELDDDELTEVSSVTSSFVASSDAPTQTDAEEIGSRITLLESDETGEGSQAKPPVEENPSSKDALEGEDLLKNDRKEKKDGEWVMLSQACDVSVELQRMRKQTLFGVKRLCCTVM